ncbi:ketoacyl-ACP synthase III [Saccharomonospora sp. NPDC006951]
MSIDIGIIGTGSYLPERVVTNADVARRVGVTPEWITRKTRIRERRYAAPGQATSDLAVRACQEALADADIPAAAIRYLILATSTPDSPQPPTSYLVQHALRATAATCIDINVVCSGFVYGLELARALLQQGVGGHAVVVAADLYSRILDDGDRSTTVLLGDGAGAAVVGPVRAGRGVLEAHLLSDGAASDLIGVEAGGSRVPSSRETVDNRGHCFRMNGRGVRDYVLERVPPAIDELVTKSRSCKESIAHFVPHQPNGNLLDELVVATGLTKASMHRTHEQYGNVGSASVPVTLDHASKAGRLNSGELVLLAGFGGGMSIGLSMVRWSR